MIPRELLSRIRCELDNNDPEFGRDADALIDLLKERGFDSNEAHTLGLAPFFLREMHALLTAMVADADV